MVERSLLILVSGHGRASEHVMNGYRRGTRSGGGGVTTGRKPGSSLSMFPEPNPKNLGSGGPSMFPNQVPMPSWQRNCGRNRKEGRKGGGGGFFSPCSFINCCTHLHSHPVFECRTAGIPVVGAEAQNFLGKHPNGLTIIRHVSTKRLRDAQKKTICL